MLVWVSIQAFTGMIWFWFAYSNLWDKGKGTYNKLLIYWNTPLLHYHKRRRYALLGRNYYKWIMAYQMGGIWRRLIIYETSFQCQFDHKNCKKYFFALEEMVVKSNQSRWMVKLELSSMMYGYLMVFIILECLHIMNSKKVTMYQKLKLIANTPR